MTRFDWIVIGGGIAGFSAASTLKRRGKSVAIIAESVGATAVSSGAWDLGNLPGKPGSRSYPDVHASPRGKERLRELLVDREDVAFPEYAEAAVREVSAALGEKFPLTFALDRSLLLPTTAGTWKRTFGAQAIQARADITELEGKRVAMVASRQWRFPSELVAGSLVERARRHGNGIAVTPLWIDLKGADWPLPQLATRLVHDERFRDLLLEALKSALATSACDAVLFPPLFLDPSYADHLGAALGVPVAECLATTEPIAGKRLTDAIRAACGTLSIPVFQGAIPAPQIAAGGIVGLKPRAGSEAAWDELRADGFILASGKLFGGGIRLGFDRVTETVFDLPVFVDRHRGPISSRRLLDDGATPWSRLGLWVDFLWRPRGADGKPVHENLKACGTVVGGVDFSTEGMGVGFMACMGRQCAASIP